MSAAPPPRPLAAGGRSDLLLGGTLTLGLSLLAFLTTGGSDLGPNTWAEIVLVLLGCGLGVAVLLFGVHAPWWGATPVALFAAMTALTAVSVTWSIVPDQSWLQASQTAAYLAVFAGAAAGARLAAERWPALVLAVAGTATVLSGYALLVKVFPGAFDASDLLGRLKAPFDYWNATGLTAAMGLPPLLWAGARRDGPRLARAAAPVAIAVLVAVLVLSYSRSALVVAVCAVVLWFALVPLRLRAAAVLALGCLGGALISLWALHTHALTHDRIPLAARIGAGHTFGLVLLVVLGLTALAGTALGFVLDRSILPPERRRQLGAGLLVAVALIPLAGVGALAASSRGLGGQISHAWNELTSTHSAVGDTSGRLVELGSSRPRYWHEGIQVGSHSPLHGFGAGAYPVARVRYTTDPLRVQHAHSYAIETFADLGAIGLAIGLALLLAWGLAVTRTLGWRRGRAPPAEHAGMCTLVCVVLAFGVHVNVDWTWSIPGTAVPALLCAGWLAGRGPLNLHAGRGRRRRLLDSPALGAATALLAVVALLGGWAIWQPLRAADADAAAIDALAAGRGAAALTSAREAVARNPLSPEPLWELGSVEAALGQPAAARAELLRAIRLQPQNPATWSELGLYDLDHGHSVLALAALERAHQLYPADFNTLAALQRAQARVTRGSRGGRSA